jgi:two-component sensor histidine kinase
VNTKGIAIAFDINCDDVKFSTTRSIAVGIIVSELISNSIKHGFINIQDPKIAIQLIQDAEGNIQLSYNDNGIGLKNLNTNNGETLGMRLIDIFSRQIKGNYTFDNNNGLLFKLNFKNESAV